MVKNFLEALMREVRELYLEKYPTRANGYYTRDLLTLAGPVEDLWVPRVWEGESLVQVPGNAGGPQAKGAERLK